MSHIHRDLVTVGHSPEVNAFDNLEFSSNEPISGEKRMSNRSLEGHLQASFPNIDSLFKFFRELCNGICRQSLLSQAIIIVTESSWDTGAETKYTLDRREDLHIS